MASTSGLGAGVRAAGGTPPPPPNKGEKKAPDSPVIVKTGSTDQQSKSQDTTAPPISPEKKAMVMHFAHQLLEPRAPTRANLGRERVAGLAYLAQQHANRRNNQSPKEARDHVFAHPQPKQHAEEIKGIYVQQEPRRAAERVQERAEIRQQVEAEALVPVPGQLAPPVPDQQAIDARVAEESRGILAEEAMSHTIIRTPNVLLADVDWTAYNRIYIPGYGQAGSNHIMHGRERFSASQVADILVNSGAVQHIQDIRVTSHNSAASNTTEPEMPILQPQHQDDLDAASAQQRSMASRLSRLAGSFVMALSEVTEAVAGTAGIMPDPATEDEPQSFAEHLSRELASRGFPNIRVTGYLGLEDPLHDASRVHHMRLVQNEAVGQVVPHPRRSPDVRIRFQNGQQVAEQPEDDAE